MGIVSKIAGIIVCVIGLLIWGIDYLIFTAIDEFTAWIATMDVGIISLAAFDVQIIDIVTLVIMVLIIILGFYVIFGGLNIIFE